MVVGHIITSTMDILGMSAIDEVPSSVPIWMKSDSERKAIVKEVASLVVEQCVDLSTIFSSPQDKCRDQSTTSDGINAYACETLSLGLLFQEFKDAVREGDGNRVIRVWKYLFKASGRANYSIETSKH